MLIAVSPTHPPCFHRVSVWLQNNAARLQHADLKNQMEKLQLELAAQQAQVSHLFPLFMCRVVLKAQRSGV